MANYVHGKPNALIDLLAPKTTRQKWDTWMQVNKNGNDPLYANRLMRELENELPFETDEEHQKWLQLGSSWMGEPEWPQMTERALKRHEKYDLDPERNAELKRYKGKDYDEAMKQYLGGVPYGDILSGLVTYEDYEYDDVDDDYIRSYGPVDNPGKYQSYLKWKENN